MSADTEKPRRKPGTMCPFWRRDVSKVCHTCDMWEPLPVGAKIDGVFCGHETIWACTLKHQTFILRDLVKSVDGMQAATESFRNDVWTESQRNLEDVIRLARHWDHGRLVDANGMKLIEGD